MEKIQGSQGKVREFCQFGKVGTMVKKFLKEKDV